MKWISRAILMLMIGSGTLLLVFGPRPHHTVPPGRTVVSYWEKWTGTEGEAMRAIVKDFNDTVGAEKGIYVEYLSLANVHYKTLSATAAGVPPDVAGLYPAQVVSYALRNAAMPLDDLAAAYGIRREDYKPVFWDMCHYKGRLYALPTTPAVVALHYNKLMFYESAEKLWSLGLDPTRPPATLQEFDRYAEALDVKIPGTNRFSRMGYFTMDSGWYIAYAPIWFGGGAWDVRRQRYDLLTPEVVGGFEWIASYSRRMGADAFGDFRSGLGAFNSPTNPFVSGSVAMVQQGPWMANYVRNYRPDFSQVIVPFALEALLPRVLRPFNYGWGVAAFPSADPTRKDISYCETDILVIPRGAAHPREAFEFMAFTQGQKQMEKLCRLVSKNSPLKKQSKDWVYAHSNPYVDVFDRLAAGPNAKPLDQTPIYLQALQEMTVAAQQVYLLQKTPRDALAGAQKQIDGLLDRFNEQQAKREAMR